MSRILLSVVLLAFTLGLAQAGHKPPQIIFRINIQTSGSPGQGMPDNQSRSIEIPPNNETIMIRSMPEVTERDLLDVQSDPAGNVHFRFNHSGQVALSAATGQNVGRIMIVSINGFIYYAPIIDQQIANGELVMPHPLDPPILQVLQQVAADNLKNKNRD